jgi:eukaryotic-like serine/threonine-protein kinase
VTHLQLKTDTLIGGRYRLLRRIGAGGMATVWLGRDCRLGRDVAVKLLSETLMGQPGFVERFAQEAKIAARLSHPNLVTVHDLGFEGDRPFLVMEYIDGETLARRAERDPAAIDRRRIAAAMLSALAHIHALGVVHRDLKPANLLFDRENEVRLTDFGIARMLEGTQLTETGQVIGTLHYMAPELRHGEPPTPRTDLYALGVLLAGLDGRGDSLDPLVDALRSADPERRPESAEAAMARLARGGRGRKLRSPSAVSRRRRAGSPRADAAPPPRAEAGSTGDRRGRPTATAAPSPPTRPPAHHGRDHGASRLRFPALALALALLAGFVIAIGSITGGGEDGESGGGAQAGREAEQGSGSAGAGSGSPDSDGSASEAPETTNASSSLPAPAPNPDPARGARLNDEGYALLQDGKPEEAVPVLRRAVRSYPGGSRDLEYAYALFNYGRALRLAGEPGQAIPVLERRLTFNDQRPTVREELRQTRAEAG